MVSAAGPATPGRRGGIPHRIGQTHGRQLAVARGRQLLYLAVFLPKQRLYQLEGTASVAGSEAGVNAMIFHPSLKPT